LRSHIVKGFEPDFRQQFDGMADVEGSITDTLRTFYRRRWLIIVITLFLFSLIAAYVSMCTPTFTSQLYMLFEAQPVKVIDFQAALSGAPQDEATLLGEIEVLRSRKLAARVIKDLALDNDPEFNPNLREQSWLRKTRTLFVRLTGWAPDSNGALSDDDRDKREEQQIVNELLNRLQVTAVPRSRVVEVSFTSESPTRAALLANSLAEAYLQMQFDRSFEVSRRASTWLADRVDEIRAKVEETELTMANYRKTHGLLQGQQKEPLVNEEISDLNARLTEASMDRISAESNLAQLRRDIASGDVDSISRVLDSNLVQRFRESELELARKDAEYREEYGGRHPRMIQLQAEKEKFKQTVQAELAKITRNLQKEVNVASAREKALNDRLASAKADLVRANQAAAGLHSLEQVAASNTILLDRFLAARTELAAQQTLSAEASAAYVMSPAVIPTAPSFPKIGLMIGGGLIASFSMAVLAAFLIDNVDSTFRSATQVEEATGVPVLSLVPNIRNLGKSRTIEDNVVKRPLSRFSEAIRGVYTRLIVVGPAEKFPTVLLFVSAYPAEGKTTIALSTARAIATSAETKVILIDADLRGSELGNRMGISKGAGLAGVLAGRDLFSDAVQHDPISPVDVLLSGNRMHDISALPHHKLQALLNSIKKEYDVIIIDSPPLFALSDPHVLTAMADVTVLVVQWGKTPRKVVNYAVELLKRASGKIAGIVLSRVRLRQLAAYGDGDAGYYSRKVHKYYTA
jgi:capsular exopolysaccharide synthesis family protein